MKAKLHAILDAAPNPWAALFGIRLLVSPRKTRAEWFAAGYRFPWERESHPFRAEREKWAYGSGKDTLNG